MGHLLILLTPLLGYSSCHVSLTFPPARDLNLDFLDNIRTPAPCGMPKGEAKMSFLAGSVFNVTWHLGYPHRGEHSVLLYFMVCVIGWTFLLLLFVFTLPLLGISVLIYPHGSLKDTTLVIC